MNLKQRKEELDHEYRELLATVPPVIADLLCRQATVAAMIEMEEEGLGSLRQLSWDSQTDKMKVEYCERMHRHLRHFLKIARADRLLHNEN